MDKDYGVVLCDELLKEIDVIGAGLGYLSASRAYGKRGEALDTLKRNIKKCKTQECKDYHNRMIANLEEKLKDSGNSSKIKRTIGGALTTGIGVGTYHVIDSHGRKKMVKRSNKLTGEK